MFITVFTVYCWVMVFRGIRQLVMVNRMVLDKLVLVWWNVTSAKMLMSEMLKLTWEAEEGDCDSELD